MFWTSLCKRNISEAWLAQLRERISGQTILKEWKVDLGVVSGRSVRATATASARVHTEVLFLKF